MDSWQFMDLIVTLLFNNLLVYFYIDYRVQRYKREQYNKNQKPKTAISS